MPSWLNSRSQPAMANLGGAEDVQEFRTCQLTRVPTPAPSTETLRRRPASGCNGQVTGRSPSQYVAYSTSRLASQPSQTLEAMRTDEVDAPDAPHYQSTLPADPCAKQALLPADAEALERTQKLFVTGSRRWGYSASLDNVAGRVIDMGRSIVPSRYRSACRSADHASGLG